MVTEETFDIREAWKMKLEEQVRVGLKACFSDFREPHKCSICPYDKNEDGTQRGYNECRGALREDALLLIDDLTNTIKLLEGDSK